MLRFKQNIISGRLVGFVIWAFLFTISYNPLTRSWAQDECETALTDAEGHFNAGRLDEVIKILESCLPEGLKNEDKSKAYRLLSLTYMAKDHLEQAKQSIWKLLELVPNWQPDPDQDPPPFTRMVEEVRKEMEEAAPEKPVKQAQEKPTEIEKPTEEPATIPAQPQKRGSKKFLWIGIGAAALGGGLLAAFAGGGGGGNSGTIPPVTGDPRLPDPPGDPGN